MGNDFFSPKKNQAITPRSEEDWLDARTEKQSLRFDFNVDFDFVFVFVSWNGVSGAIALFLCISPNDARPYIQTQVPARLGDSPPSERVQKDFCIASKKHNRAKGSGYKIYGFDESSREVWASRSKAPLGLSFRFFFSSRSFFAFVPGRERLANPPRFLGPLAPPERQRSRRFRPCGTLNV